MYNYLLTWIILSTTNPCDSRIGGLVSWRGEQRKKNHDQKIGKTTVLLFEPLAVVAGSSGHAGKTDSGVSLLVTDRRLLEYSTNCGLGARGGLWRRHFARGDRFDWCARAHARAFLPANSCFSRVGHCRLKYCPRHKQNNSQTASYS